MRKTQGFRCSLQPIQWSFRKIVFQNIPTTKATIDALIKGVKHQGSGLPTPSTHPETARILGTNNNLIVYIQKASKSKAYYSWFPEPSIFWPFWTQIQIFKRNTYVAAGRITFEDLQKFLRGLVPGQSCHINPTVVPGPFLHAFFVLFRSSQETRESAMGWPKYGERWIEIWRNGALTSWYPPASCTFAWPMLSHGEWATSAMNGSHNWPMSQPPFFEQQTWDWTVNHWMACLTRKIAVKLTIELWYSLILAPIAPKSVRATSQYVWLVVWNINFFFPYIGNVIIPID